MTFQNPNKEEKLCNSEEKAGVNVKKIEKGKNKKMPKKRKTKEKSKAKLKQPFEENEDTRPKSNQPPRRPSEGSMQNLGSP